MKREEALNHGELRCSFCQLPQSEHRKLIGGRLCLCATSVWMCASTFSRMIGDEPWREGHVYHTAAGPEWCRRARLN